MRQKIILGSLAPSLKEKKMIRNIPLNAIRLGAGKYIENPVYTVWNHSPREKILIIISNISK